LKRKKQEAAVTEDRPWAVRLKYFLLGLMTISAVIFLMGNRSSTPSYGRFQISSWGTAFGDFSGGCGAFIIDTATGETKTAYMYIYGTSDGMSILKNNLGKSFYEIK
jgi:hypothetical protein